MVGIQSFPFVAFRPIFRGELAVSFRACKSPEIYDLSILIHQKGWKESEDLPNLMGGLSHHSIVTKQILNANTTEASKVNCLVILEFVHLSTTCQFLDFMMARIYDGYNLSGLHWKAVFVR